MSEAAQKKRQCHQGTEAAMLLTWHAFLAMHMNSGEQFLRAGNVAEAITGGVHNIVQRNLAVCPWLFVWL